MLLKDSHAILGLDIGLVVLYIRGMSQPITLDEAAMQILISSGLQVHARLKALKKQADRYHGNVCPECDGKDIDDNGATRMSERTYLCNDCGHQWDAES